MSTQSSMCHPLVLIVEDEKQIRRFVRAALEEEECTVCEAATSAQGLFEAGSRKPDLVLLDLGLPDGNGVDFIRELRAWSAVPILVLSARSNEKDKIEALDVGADDYLTKPFGVQELLARVRALLRRAAEPRPDNNPIIHFGEFTLDCLNHALSRAGEPVKLSQIEYRLLLAMVGNPGRVLTHRQLLTQVWGGKAAENNEYLRVYVGHLRQKIEDNPAQPRHIQTEIGVGYRFQL